MAAVYSPNHTANDATSANGPTFEAPLNLEDDWRQIEDDDWPSELMSSMDHDSRPGHHTNGPDAHIHDAVHDSPTSNATEKSIQQGPIKISLLTRPTSSHEDPATGFSFTKAKPVQPLDFSRKIASNTTIPSRSNISPTSPQNKIQAEGGGVSSTGAIQATMNSGHSSITSTTSPKPATARTKLFDVPFPNVIATASPESAHLAQTRVEKQHEEHPLSAAPAQNDVSMSGDDTLVEPELVKVNPEANQNDSINDSEKFMPELIQSHNTRTSTTIRSPEGNATYKPIPTSATIRSPRDDNAVYKPIGDISQPPKAPIRARLGTKIRKKKQAPQTNTPKITGSSNQNILPKEADLLQMLLYKHKQNDHERDNLQKALKAKAAEYDELYAASEDLYAQLQDMSQRYSANEAQLSKIKEAKPGWERKIKKLSDFVKGLTNDHNRLRDEAKDMTERQDAILKDKDSVFSILREVYQSTEKKHSASKQKMAEAHHDLEVLGKSIHNQQMQLEQEKALLSSERDRNDRLEKQISTFTASHAQVISLISGHRDAISGKIAELLNKYKEIQFAPPPASQDSLKPILEQCFSILKELPNTDDRVRPADIQRLNESMEGQLEMISNSIKNCEHSSTASKEEQQQLALSLKNHFQSLSNAIATEHTLSEQIMELREMKATVREQLQGTEMALQEARLELIRVQNKNSEQSTKVAALENHTRNLQPTQDPNLILRLQELDALGRDLRRDLDSKIIENASFCEQLQQKDEAMQFLQNRWSDTQTQLREARQQVEAIQQKISQSEKQAILEREEMRRRLSKAADQELEDLKSKHLNALQQQKLKHASAEESHKEASLQLIMMKNEKEDLEKKAADANVALEAEQSLRVKQDTLAGRLRLRITDLEKQLEEKQTTHETLQQLLRDTELDNQAKDEYIKGMQRDSARKKAARSPSSRSSNVPQAPRSKPPVMVEDSQPNGYPSFASHEDIMHNNSGSQLMAAEEDLSGLFPLTPKGESQKMEVSRVIYSSTRVTSRDGANASEVQRQRPREIASRQGPQINKLANGRFDPNSPARRSQSSFAAPKSQPSKSPSKANQSQKSSQVLGSVPRGILKSTAHDTRGEKRNAAESELNDTAGFTAPKRRKSNMTRDLGPVVQDSQSPVNILSDRGRKQTVTRKSRKDDKFTIAFAGRLAGS